MTPEQEKQVLQMVEEWNHIGWLLSWMAKVSKWITAVSAGTSVLYFMIKTKVG